MELALEYKLNPPSNDYLAMVQDALEYFDKKESAEAQTAATEKDQEKKTEV